MQIIIPMSGFGERFLKAGYSVPKPFDAIKNIIKYSFSEAFYRDNIMNPSHYDEESSFHYYGNKVYGEGKFLLDLQNNFRNN